MLSAPAGRQTAENNPASSGVQYLITGWKLNGPPSSYEKLLPAQGKKICRRRRIRWQGGAAAGVAPGQPSFSGHSPARIFWKGTLSHTASRMSWNL